MSKPHSIKETDYVEACDSNQGWCTKCKAFTHDFCEPDAEKYECPDCGAATCYGAEQALLLQLIDFGTDDQYGFVQGE